MLKQYLMISNLFFFFIFAPLKAFTISNCDEMPRIGIVRTEINGSPVVISTVEKEIPMDEKFVIDILNDEAEFEAKRNLIIALNDDKSTCSLSKRNFKESLSTEDELGCDENITEFNGLKTHKICYSNNKKLILSVMYEMNSKDNDNIFKKNNEKMFEEGSFSNTRNLINF